MADEVLDHGAIGLDAVGHRIAARDVHDALVHQGVALQRDVSGLKLLDIHLLGLRKSVEHVRRQTRIGLKQFIADDNEMVDRIMAAARQRGEARFLRIGDQRHDVGMIDRYADGGDKFA